MKTGLTQAGILTGILTTVLPLGNITHAGIITLDTYQDTALDFTSTWTWINQPNNGGWATQGAVNNLNFIDPIDGVNDWYISLEGFAGGNLIDKSIHETDPHNDGPVPLSYFNYPGASAGINFPIGESFINHGNHSDEYSLTSAVQVNGDVLIDFSGIHLDGSFPGSCSINGGSIDCQSKTLVPLPPAIWLFGSGLLSMLYFRKKTA